MKAKIILLAIISVIIVSCQSSQKATQLSNNEHNSKLIAVAWYQNSPEMMALYYQGFNLAQERLDDAIASNKQSKPLAVVADIDETLLNNSPFEVNSIKNTNDQTSWHEWSSKAGAKALPGALEFAKYIQSKGAELFYITNRDDNERAATLKNLISEGFPFADDAHLLTKSDLSYSTGSTSSKVGRRAKVSENHEIVLLLGDNLNDFSEAFEDRSQNYGKEAVEKFRDEFGEKFIVLPNPIYGAWEKPLYDYKSGLTEEEKTTLLKSKLRTE